MSTEQSRKTCCFTGHKDIAAPQLEHIKSELQKEILQAAEDGYTHFISGFEEGVEMIFASIVANMMTINRALTLEAAIPYRSRMNTDDTLFHQLLAKCHIVGVHSEAYSPFCYIKRNREMVSLSQRIIAVYDGREKGRTLFTMRYAYTQGRDVRVIRI